MAGSTRRASPVEHIDWFGQPAQADVRPASVLDVPGQACGASAGTSFSASTRNEVLSVKIGKKVRLFFVT